MTALLYTQGLPGAGKTTWCRQWMAGHPDAVYVSTDAIREHLYGQRWNGVHADADPQVRHARDMAASDALRAGRDVLIDGTNLTAEKVAHWHWLADLLGADVQCIDLTGVPLDTCIRQALQQRRGVDDGVVAYIRDLHTRYLTPAEVAA